ncbi:MAG: GntR family transcriptional regulator [Alphaproteobacteria bacterium]|nr:GntR family transcriptional regulator [Alphaproteobacteria bacterium]
MTSKSEKIYQLMRREIIRLELAPGAAISEKDLGRRFQSSRTPVHEAVQRLAKEGLVVILPQSGTYVCRLSRQTSEEGFIIRRALEIEAVRRAATRISPSEIMALRESIEDMRRILHDGPLLDYINVDDTFHAQIAAASGLVNIWRFINQAKVHLDRLRHLSTPVPGHLERVTDEHTLIVDALEAHDRDKAELSLRVHLDASYEVMRRLGDQQSHLFADEPEGG